MNARPFVKMLLRAQDELKEQQQEQQQQQQQQHSLHGSRFSVIGLGSSSWTITYQKVPRLLNCVLSECGAVAIAPPVELDSIRSRARYQQLQKWFADIQDELGVSSSKKKKSVQASTESLLKALLKPNFVLEWTRAGSALRPSIAMNAVWLTVAAVSKCLPPDCGHSVVHVKLSIPSDASQACKFVAGDHIMVYGRNSSSLVARALKRFGLSHEASVILRPDVGALAPSSVQDLPFDTAISVVDLLAAHVELAGPVEMLQLKALAAHCDKLTRAKIERIINDTAPMEPQSLLEVLERMPHVTLSFHQFLYISTRMKPRLYSICNMGGDGSIELLVSVQKKGLCSNFLESHIRIGEPVLCQVQPNVLFHLPAEHVPLVLVGAGTGLAPLRALLQSAASRSLAGWVVYFGCRTRDEFLFADELQTLERERGLRVVPVYSRSGPNPQYVGDYMCDNVDEFRQQLTEQRGLVYICGASKIVERVMHAVALAVGKDQADAMLSSRIKMDVWQEGNE